jgi:glycosyltransferase involved in cell wall biosynthesis
MTVNTTRMKRGSTVWLPPDELKRLKKAEEDKIPRFTIIIPTHNQYDSLLMSFNSVYSQLGDSDNVIIADQGSTDGTQSDIFPTDTRVFYLSYPNVKKMEIVNFAILNVVQTRYIILLDSRSLLQKKALSRLRDSLGKKPVSALVMFKNVGMQLAGSVSQVVDYPPRNMTPTTTGQTKVLPSMYSYSGYMFQKTDAIRAGLFVINNDFYAPGLFMDRMKRLGCSISYRDEFAVNTIYNDLKEVGWKEEHQDMLDILKEKSGSSGYKINGMEPISIIIVDKQSEVENLINQVKLPNDEVKMINTFTSANIIKKFDEEVKQSKFDRIMLVRGENPEPIYDPITNLRLLFDRSRVLTSGVERGINCTIFSKHLYRKPNARTDNPDIDKIIKEIAAKAKTTVELTDLIVHPSRIQTQTVMKGGSTIEEPVRNVHAERRRRKITIHVPKGRNQRVKKVVDRPDPRSTSVTVGIPQYSMKWKSVDKLPPIPGIKNRTPKILFICDVEGWAWHYKSQQLKKHLSDEFIIDIIWLIGPGARAIKPKVYDLYVTFGYSYIDYLKNVSPRKKITGITAHRPHSVLHPQMQKAAVVHANSKMLYHELKTMHDIVYYVPNGVDEEMFYPIEPIPEERNNIVVGHVGKLSVMKGQEQFIKPAITQAQAIPLFHFNDYTNALPISQMPNIYQGMDVFIVASTEDGTPNPALEAAACGRPIISNRIGNMPEFIRNGYNGFLVEKNIGAYSEKINFLRNNRDKLIEMGHNARKTVEEGWTWKIQSERYRKMFKEVLGIE